VVEQTGNMVPVEHLRQAFDYRPETGLIIDREHGRPVGRRNWRGYVLLQFQGKSLLAHRVAWALHHGYWPKELDHKNGDASDNRLTNLRECTRAGNMQNRRGMKVGLKGTSKWKRKWKAQIVANGEPIYLGLFDTEEAAHAAYVDAAAKYHGEYAKTE
jgi:hypothetical protein